MDESDARAAPIDLSRPLKGVVICCTDIPPNERTDIENKTRDLGGVHKYDLTPDATHLVVGSHDTQKYRHVARSRPDVKAMDAGWIETVTDLWRRDAHIDLPALEKAWQLRPLEVGGTSDSGLDGLKAKRKSLLVCLTGFDDPEERLRIQTTITSNGGQYTGDLTKRVTHLIVKTPQGRKYEAAKNWGVHTVTLQWLDQSVTRGMILDEKCFDPLLPPEKQGVGAFEVRDPARISLGKRQSTGSVSGEDGPKRKLRKTASIKLNSQRDMLWDDMLGKKESGSQLPPATVESAPPDVSSSARYSLAPQLQTEPAPLTNEGLFGPCLFYITGFDQRKKDILAQAIEGLGGAVCAGIDELQPVTVINGLVRNRYVVVPQDRKPESLVKTVLEARSAGAQVVTEFFIESSLHSKKLVNPDDHVLGRPFPVFPIRGFEGLSICSAGFTGIELHHLDLSVRQLGARFEETFRRTASLLLCKSPSSVRKEKLKLALDTGIPVVSIDWLWACIGVGVKVPVADFMFPELKQRVPGQGVVETRGAKQSSRPISKPEASRRDGGGGAVDSRAQGTVARQESASTANFHTAQTHPFVDLADSPTQVPAQNPLEEVSPNARPPSSPKSSTPSDDTNTPQPHSPPPPPKLPAKPKYTISRPQNDHGDHDRKQSENEEEAEAEAEAETEEARKRTQTALEKQKERLAISTKLSSLLDPSPTNPPSDLDNPATEPGTNPSANDDSPPPKGNASRQKPRRKREIMGRAVSSVSTCSVDAPIHLDAMGSTEMGMGLGESGDGDGTNDMPGTQVVYDDREGRIAKEALMSRLAGKRI